MATFTFGRAVDIHWQGYEVVGPAGTVFSIPDQLYNEFNDDIAPVEPTLVWVDTNEFLTLSNSVSVSNLTGSIPISVTSTTSGKVVAISSTTNPAGYNLVADGTGGVIFQAASTGALTSIVGISPMSTIIVGNTASVILNASYQTAGTYVTGVVGTSPISATGTTAITVTIDQAAITAGNASSAQATVYLVRNNTASTILKGTLVSATGAESSGRIDIAPFSVTGLQDSELRVMGIATENIGVGVNGIVMSFGTLTGLDTRGTAASALAVGDEDWDEGTILYAHPTVPGKLTEVRPQHDLAVAFTTVRHASTGQIAIRIVPGNFHLEWMHDVFVDGVSTALPLVYNSTSSGWVAQALTSVGIADNAVVAAKIAAGAVGSAAIGSGAVVAAGIAAGAVGSAALASGAVVSAAISAGAVGTAAISSGSATSGQILQANGSGAVNFVTASSGAMTLISTTTLGTSAQEFTISNIPSTYKHLILYAYKLKSSTTSENALVIRWNSVTTSTYNWRTTTNYSTSNTSLFTSNNADDVVSLAGSVATANIILVASDGNATSAVEMTFYDYASSDRKLVAGRSTYPLSSTSLYGMSDFVASNSGTAAISSITLRSTSAVKLIASGAVIGLYGVS